MITEKEIEKAAIYEDADYRIEEQHQYSHTNEAVTILKRLSFRAGAKWAIEKLTEHKELTLTLDNGEIKPAADGNCKES